MPKLEVTFALSKTTRISCQARLSNAASPPPLVLSMCARLYAHALGLEHARALSRRMQRWRVPRRPTAFQHTRRA